MRLVALLFIMFALPALAQEVDDVDRRRYAGGSLRFLYARLKASMEYERLGGSGNQAHADRDFPMDRYEPAYEAQVWGHLDRAWRLEARYLGAAFRERGALRDDLIHDAAGFSAGDLVSSRIELHVVSWGARAFVTSGDGLRASIPFGVQWTQQRLRIEDRFTPNHGDGRIETWTPYVGFGLEGRLVGGLGLRAEVRFFAYSLGRVDRHAYAELDLEATYSILDGRLSLHTGPRVFAQDHHAEYSNGNDRVSDFTLVAWQVGLTLDF